MVDRQQRLEPQVYEGGGLGEQQTTHAMHDLTGLREDAGSASTSAHCKTGAYAPSGVVTMTYEKGTVDLETMSLTLAAGHQVLYGSVRN